MWYCPDFTQAFKVMWKLQKCFLPFIDSSFHNSNTLFYNSFIIPVIAYSSTSTSFPSSSSYTRPPSSHTISPSPPRKRPASSSSSHIGSRHLSMDDDNTQGSSSSSVPYRPFGSTTSSYPQSNCNRQYDEDSQQSVGSSVGTLNSHASSVTTSNSNVLKNPPKPIYVMRPGSFEIVLCVDNCEAKGG